VPVVSEMMQAAVLGSRNLAAVRQHIDWQVAAHIQYHRTHSSVQCQTCN
jgi:hypothetical protein